MNTFFDENGILNLDDAVMQMPSFKKIMEDGIVTDVELADQAAHVTALLHKVEDSCTQEQTAMIKDLLAEMSVLFAAYNYKELQTLK